MGRKVPSSASTVLWRMPWTAVRMDHRDCRKKDGATMKGVASMTKLVNYKVMWALYSSCNRNQQSLVEEVCMAKCGLATSKKATMHDCLARRVRWIWKKQRKK